MNLPFNIGVLQLSMEPVRETVAMAKACEQAGFDTFWIAEAYPWWRKHSFEARSSTAILAVIARETARIQLGWGIISPYTRHPVQIAMEARVMQDLAGDRFLLGLGASKIFMKEIGEGEGEKVGPATVMRESIDIVRGVLAGGAFEYQGRIFAASVPPLRDDAHTPSSVPRIYVAGTGRAQSRGQSGYRRSPEESVRDRWHPRRVHRAHRGIPRGRLYAHHAGNLGRRPHRAGQALRRSGAAAFTEIAGAVLQA